MFSILATKKIRLAFLFLRTLSAVLSCSRPECDALVVEDVGHLRERTLEAARGFEPRMDVLKPDRLVGEAGAVEVDVVLDETNQSFGKALSVAGWALRKQLQSRIKKRLKKLISTF